MNRKLCDRGLKISYFFRFSSTRGILSRNPRFSGRGDSTLFPNHQSKPVEMPVGQLTLLQGRC